MEQLLLSPQARLDIVQSGHLLPPAGLGSQLRVSLRSPTLVQLYEGANWFETYFCTSHFTPLKYMVYCVADTVLSKPGFPPPQSSFFDLSAKYI